MVPFLWMRFNYLKARATLLKQFTFSGSFWYSFYRPWKDERPSRPWIHPVNLGATLEPPIMHMAISFVIMQVTVSVVAMYVTVLCSSFIFLYLIDNNFS